MPLTHKQTQTRSHVHWRRWFLFVHVPSTSTPAAASSTEKYIDSRQSSIKYVEAYWSGKRREYGTGNGCCFDDEVGIGMRATRKKINGHTLLDGDDCDDDTNSAPYPTVLAVMLHHIHHIQDRCSTVCVTLFLLLLQKK